MAATFNFSIAGQVTVTSCRDEPSLQIIGYSPWDSHLPNGLAVLPSVSGYDPHDTLVGSDHAASSSGWITATFESCRDDT